jgi:hypothetical protein
LKAHGCNLVIAAALVSAACGAEPPVDRVHTEVTTRTGSDSAWVTVRWSPRDTGLVFPWRNVQRGADEAGSALADTTSETEVVFQVALPESDREAEFCLEGLRVIDGKRTGEACTDYVIPAEPPPLPEPGAIHVALIHETTQYQSPTCLEQRQQCVRRDDAGECTRSRRVCVRSEPRDTLACLTLRWDSVPDASHFVAELHQPGQRPSRVEVNDDSCPACRDVGIDGGRWPCFDFQGGCRFNVTPYFSAAWCVARPAEAQTLQARILALDSGGRATAEHAVEWAVPGRGGS